MTAVPGRKRLVGTIQDVRKGEKKLGDEGKDGEAVNNC